MMLFCLPYAGGSEAIYYKWRTYLNPNIKLTTIELKGRGKRYSENFYENVEEAVEDILKNIKDKIIYEDYFIYGHSMGALLAYELYYKIKEEKLKMPKHIFFSGCKPPNIIEEKKKIHTLPDCEFKKRIIELGGIQQELIDNEELFQIFIPIIRNDFKIIENYKYIEKERKIQCGISVLNGTEDDIKIEEILLWKQHGDDEFKLYNFKGNHFFINDNIEHITNIINNTLIK